MIDEVVVLILNYNGKHFLETCLTAVLHQTYSSFQVVVIDNGSSDGSVDFVRTRFPDVGLIEADNNLLFARGNNLGLKQMAADYPYAVLLNNDTVAAPTWLEELVKPTIEPQVGIVTSTVRERSKPYYGYSLNVWTGTIVGNQTHPPNETIFPVFYASGCSMLIKTDVLQKIGFLEDDFGCYFEDVDLCWRAWLAGYKTVCNSRALVDHHGGGTNQNVSRSYKLVERNRLLTYFKNLEPTTLVQVFPVMLICRIMVALIVRRNRAMLQGILDGLRRIPAYRSKRATIQNRRLVSDRHILPSNESATLSNVLNLLREAMPNNVEKK